MVRKYVKNVEKKKSYSEKHGENKFHKFKIKTLLKRGKDYLCVM